MKRNSASEKRSLLQQHDQSFLDQGFKSLAGVDEAGRGPLAGPVVASAVIVRDFSFVARVDDSKKMSAQARDTAYDEILAKCQVGIAVVEPEGPQGIDALNILQASMKAMADAVMKLGSLPDCLLIDGPKAPRLPFKQYPIVDGDAKSFSIACASIVAKVTRDRMMDYYDAIYPGYGFKQHKGYGTKDHIEALKKQGPCKIHRKTFEPIKSLWKHS